MNKKFEDEGVGYAPVQTLKSLIDTNLWQDVKDIFIKLYPEDEQNIEGYKAVFERLKTIKPKKKNWKLFIETGHDDSVPYYLYFKDNKNERCGLDFVPWNECLGMEISEETISAYSAIEIIAHVLQEITFYGFQEEVIQTKFNNISGLPRYASQ
jgi:hypothetical protein